MCICCAECCAVGECPLLPDGPDEWLAELAELEAEVAAERAKLDAWSAERSLSSTPTRLPFVRQRG